MGGCHWSAVGHDTTLLSLDSTISSDSVRGISRVHIAVIELLNFVCLVFEKENGVGEFIEGDGD